MTDARLTKAISRFVKKVRDERIDGIVGRGLNYADVAAPRNNHIWVTIADSATQIRNTGPGRVLARAGLPVKLIRRYNGDLVLDGNDISGLLDDDDNAPGDVFTVNLQGPDSHGNVTLDTDDIDEGSTNLYYTAERARDDIGTALVEGAGIDITVSDPGDTITIASTVTAYTDEQAQDAVGTILVDSASIDFTYSDATPSITATVIDEYVADLVGTMVTGNTETDIAVTYQDSDNTIDFVVSATLVGDRIHAATGKTTPVDADELGLSDSAASFVLKKLTWANLKATLKTYFDTLYNLYVHPNHTGDVTSVGDGATTIAADAVTNAKAANMAADTIKGRANGAGTGDPTDLTATQVRTIINVANGADVTGTAITALATKTTPVDADAVVITDSAASDAPKRVTGTNWKAYMKTYFDTLYGLLASANTWTQQNQFNPANTTGVGLGVTRNLAAASTDSPVVSILNDHASDDQPTAVIGQDAPADILQLLDGGTKVFVAFDGGNIGAGVSAITDIYSGFLSTNPRVLQVNEPTSTSGTGRPAALILSATKTTGGDNIGSVYFCNLNNAGAEKRIVQFGAFTGTDSDDGIFFVLVAKDGVANEVFRVDEDGQMGIGTQAPQGKHHVHDGTGGSMFVTKTAVAGTKVVIIPNATGDVLSSVTCMYALANSDGTKIGSTFNCPVSGSVPVTVGGTTWTFSVAANGEFSVIRTAGTDTAIIAMQLVWR